MIAVLMRYGHQQYSEILGWSPQTVLRMYEAVVRLVKAETGPARMRHSED